MITKRNLTSFLFIASLGVAAGAAALSPTEASAGGDCNNPKTAEVKKWCKDGGQTAVKKKMKKIEKAAKKGGVDMDCSDCHKDKKTFPLKDNAEADYKKWKAAAKKGGFDADKD